MSRYVALALALLGGCGSASNEDDPQAVPYISIVVTPNRAELGVGQTVQLKVFLVRTEGNQPVGGRFASNNDTIAAVDPDTGIVTALAPGTTSIQAGYGSASTSVEIVVR